MPEVLEELLQSRALSPYGGKGVSGGSAAHVEAAEATYERECRVALRALVGSLELAGLDQTDRGGRHGWLRGARGAQGVPSLTRRSSAVSKCSSNTTDRHFMLQHSALYV